MYMEGNHSEQVKCHSGGTTPCNSRRAQLAEYRKSLQQSRSNKIDLDKLPVYPSKEVSMHNGKDHECIWMSYGGLVYDVTDFIPLHPGGTERISRAAGTAIEPFWYLHQQHYDNNEAMDILQGLVVGRLAEQDQEAIEAKLETLQRQLDSFRLEIDMPGNGSSIQKLSLNDLKALPKTDRMSQVGCPNSSKGPVTTSLFGGVLMKDLLGGTITTQPGTRLVFYAMDGETVSIEADNYNDILVSFEENGAPLTQGRGFPLRVIIPGRRVIKWVKRIEVQ